MAKLIREFVVQGIATKKRGKSSGEILLELVSYATKGAPKDVSFKHSEYLYGGSG